MGAEMKIELIENWRKWYKLWSVRLVALGTVLAGWFIASPDAFLQVWMMLPQDLKDTLPPEVVKYIPIAILTAGTLARVVKQNKLPQVNTDESA